MEKKHKKERRVLQELVLQSKDDIKEILEYFRHSSDNCQNTATEEAIEDIFIVIMKIIRRAMRFVEYRSKIRVLNRGEKVSKKEFDRCDFILKITSKNKIKIIKNNLIDITGKFNRAEIISK